MHNYITNQERLSLWRLALRQCYNHGYRDQLIDLKTVSNQLIAM